MPASPSMLDRPQRWDASFDPEMSDAIVERLLAVAPFREMNPEAFAGSVKALPARADLTMPINEKLVVELYSK